MDLLRHQFSQRQELLPLAGEQLNQRIGIGREQTPSVNLIKRSFLKTNLLLAKVLGQAGWPGLRDGVGGRELLCDHHRNRPVE